MKIELILLTGHLLISVLGRFFAKKHNQKIIIRLFSCCMILVWIFYYCASDFLVWNVWLLCASIIYAFLLYLISLFIVGTNFSLKNIFPTKIFKIKGNLFKSFKSESIRNLFSSSYEELLYRCFFLNAFYLLTKSAIIAILVTILYFFAVHIRKGLAIVQMIDIFVFSFAITVFFYYTKNPVYSVIIHIIRNQFVISQKYLSVFDERERIHKYMKKITERK